MIRSSALIFTLLALLSMSQTACGPSCVELKTGLSADSAMNEDVTRLNHLVKLRKDAIEDAKTPGHDQFTMQRLKFSVTALEQAAWTQLRIIKSSPKVDDSDLYLKNIRTINEFRCFLDDVIADQTHSISDGAGKTILSFKERIDRSYKKECDLSSSEFADYLEEGISSKE